MWMKKNSDCAWEEAYCHSTVTYKESYAQETEEVNNFKINEWTYVNVTCTYHIYWQYSQDNMATQNKTILKKKEKSERFNHKHAEGSEWTPSFILMFSFCLVLHEDFNTLLYYCTILHCNHKGYMTTGSLEGDSGWFKTQAQLLGFHIVVREDENDACF